MSIFYFNVPALVLQNASGKSPAEFIRECASEIISPKNNTKSYIFGLTKSALNRQIAKCEKINDIKIYSPQFQIEETTFFSLHNNHAYVQGNASHRTGFIV